MSTLSRIMKLASKALGASSSSSSGGATDWRAVVRTAADRVTGDSRPAGSAAPARPETAGRTPAHAAGRPAAATSDADRSAIARYDYLLKTAPPEQLEQVHRDAFGSMEPAARDQVRARLQDELPPAERPASASPDDLARSATRAEATRPGTLRRLFAHPAATGAMGVAAGVGLGAAGGMLAAVAGGAMLSGVAGPLLAQATAMGTDFESLAGDLASAPGEYVSGIGEQVSEFGSGFELPGLGGLFDRD